MPLDPAIRDAMRDSRNAFNADEDFDDEEFDEVPGGEEPIAVLRRAGLTTDLQGREASKDNRRYTERDEESYDPFGEDADDDEDDVAPVKVKNPNLSNRLPREDFAPCVDFDDRPPLMERCAEVLGDRLKVTRMGFVLDGKIANTDKVVAAAGLLFKDQEPPRKSALPRQRKRKKKF